MGGPLFFAALRDRPSGYLNTPLTVVAAGMAKWLDIYSGVLMVRVLLSWFPNIPWIASPSPRSGTSATLTSTSSATSSRPCSIPWTLALSSRSRCWGLSVRSSTTVAGCIEGRLAEPLYIRIACFSSLQFYNYLHVAASSRKNPLQPHPLFSFSYSNNGRRGRRCRGGAAEEEDVQEVQLQRVDLDALLDMSTDELVKLFHARARRRFQRGLKRKPMALIKKLRKAKKEAPPGEKPEPVRTHLRNMIIVPEMIGASSEFSISYKPVKHGRPGIGATHSSRFIPLK
uniref:40S ribosomal protein S15 n=1 Tax=Ananas comosus var. bracteatus TaxID=296719 RepID=A0A6V7NML9_ANACO|nr:unnamed protein product [Ananas comosus var. bracteatus]